MPLTKAEFRELEDEIRSVAETLKGIEHYAYYRGSNPARLLDEGEMGLLIKTIDKVKKQFREKNVTFPLTTDAGLTDEMRLGEACERLERLRKTAKQARIITNGSFFSCCFGRVKETESAKIIIEPR